MEAHRNRAEGRPKYMGRSLRLLRNRKFIGAELKESYWKQACENLRLAEAESQHDLFTLAGSDA